MAQANPGVDSSKLQIGQKLNIPTTSSVPAAATATTATSGIYTVKKGDNLTRIARTYGTTVPELKRMNGLVTDTIIIGQKLKVPSTEP